MMSSLKKICLMLTAPLLSMLMILYFSYHMLHGERGIIAYVQMKKDIRIAEQRLAQTEQELAKLENKVRLLRPENTDPDMLEERARQILNLGRPGDLIIIERDM